MVQSGAFEVAHVFALTTFDEWPLVQDYGVAAAVHEGHPQGLTQLYEGLSGSGENFVIDRLSGAWLCLVGERETGMRLLREADEPSAALALEACEGRVEAQGLGGSWGAARYIARHGGAAAWLDAAPPDDPARLSVLASALLDDPQPATDAQLQRWLVADARAMVSPDLARLASGSASFFAPTTRSHGPQTMLDAAARLRARADAHVDPPFAALLRAGVGALASQASFECLVRGDNECAKAGAQLAAELLDGATQELAVALLVQVDPTSERVGEWLAAGAQGRPELELRALMGRGERGLALARARAFRLRAEGEDERTFHKWEVALLACERRLGPNGGGPHFEGWQGLASPLRLAREWATPAGGKRARVSLGHLVLDPERPVLDLLILAIAAPEDGDAEVWLDTHFGGQFRSHGFALLWARETAARWRGDDEAAERWAEKRRRWRELADDEDGWLLLSLAL